MAEDCPVDSPYEEWNFKIPLRPEDDGDPYDIIQGISDDCDMGARYGGTYDEDTDSVSVDAEVYTPGFWESSDEVRKMLEDWFKVPVKMTRGWEHRKSSLPEETENPQDFFKDLMSVKQAANKLENDELSEEARKLLLLDQEWQSIDNDSSVFHSDVTEEVAGRVDDAFRDFNEVLESWLDTVESPQLEALADRAAILLNSTDPDDSAEKIELASKYYYEIAGHSYSEDLETGAKPPAKQEPEDFFKDLMSVKQAVNDPRRVIEEHIRKSTRKLGSEDGWAEANAGYQEAHDWIQTHDDTHPSWDIIYELMQEADFAMDAAKEAMEPWDTYCPTCGADECAHDLDDEPDAPEDFFKDLMSSNQATDIVGKEAPMTSKKAGYQDPSELPIPFSGHDPTEGDLLFGIEDPCDELREHFNWEQPVEDGEYTLETTAATSKNQLDRLAKELQSKVHSKHGPRFSRFLARSQAAMQLGVGKTEMLDMFYGGKDEVDPFRMAAAGYAAEARWMATEEAEEEAEAQEGEFQVDFLNDTPDENSDSDLSFDESPDIGVDWSDSDAGSEGWFDDNSMGDDVGDASLGDMGSEPMAVAAMVNGDDRNYDWLMSKKASTVNVEEVIDTADQDFISGSLKQFVMDNIWAVEPANEEELGNWLGENFGWLPPEFIKSLFMAYEADVRRGTYAMSPKRGQDENSLMAGDTVEAEDGTKGVVSSVGPDGSVEVSTDDSSTANAAIFDQTQVESGQVKRVEDDNVVTTIPGGETYASKPLARRLIRQPKVAAGEEDFFKDLMSPDYKTPEAGGGGDVIEGTVMTGIGLDSRVRYFPDRDEFEIWMRPAGYADGYDIEDVAGDWPFELDEKTLRDAYKQVTGGDPMAEIYAGANDTWEGGYVTTWDPNSDDQLVGTFKAEGNLEYDPATGEFHLNWGDPNKPGNIVDQISDEMAKPPFEGWQPQMHDQ